MKEKDIQRLFGKVINVHGVFELKLVKGNSMPFAAVKEHQEAALLAVSMNRGLYHKISDSPIFAGMKTRFTAQKPFDCFFLRNTPAYVGICFYEPRKPKEVVLIEITKYLGLKLGSKRKSLTREEAYRNAEHIIILR